MKDFYQTKYKSAELIALLVAIGVAMRLMPHLPNFTPIGALAVWGGMRLAPGKNALFVLATMIISDLFLGFHSTVLYVYGSLLLVTWLASRMPVKVGPVIGTTLVGSVLFFLITNFGVWQASTMYPHTLAGLLQSYTMAIPFFRSSGIGDAFYTVILFGVEYVVLTAVSKANLKNQTSKVQVKN
jgi:hypothetical protein